MNHIEIGGVQHPLLFNMIAIEAVMEDLNATDFSQLSEHVNSALISKSLKFTRICAHRGIQAGYRKLKQQNPFEDIDDLADAIQSFYDVEPAMIQFTKSVEEFFKPRQSEGFIETIAAGEPKRKKQNP
jgi:hypothetical protein